MTTLATEQRLRPLARVLRACACACAWSSAMAQPLTLQSQVTAPRNMGQAAFDATRGRVVCHAPLDGLFGGVSVRWEWDGTGWQSIPGEDAPSGDLVADDQQHRLFCFGSAGLSEWDGARWILRWAGGLPQAVPVVFDARRRRVMLLIVTMVGEWDGSRWWSIVDPNARRSPAKAWDPVRQRVVRFGGTTTSGLFTADTWSWDGSAWTQLATGQSPSPRIGAAMAWDPIAGHLLLFGGANATTSFDDSWALGANGWTQLFPNQTPGTRTNAHLVFDGSGMLLVGGTGPQQDDTWRWNGTDWQQLAPAADPLGNRGDSRGRVGFVWDSTRGQPLLFGGVVSAGGFNVPTDETWIWDGKWRQQQPAVRPPARASFGLADDPARGEVILFGGSLLNDTWTWNGSAWTQRSPANVPPARFDPVLTPDRATATVLMFGGFDGNTTVLDDQWHWNGVDWQPFTGPRPPARFGAAACSDETRNRIVLYGGQTTTGTLPETWEWDGAQWTQIATATRPIAIEHSLAFDHRVGRVTMLGVDGMHRWSGTDWVASTETTETINGSTRMVGDARRQRLLLFTASQPHLRMLTPTPAAVAHYGAGCAVGAAPGLAVRAQPLPGTTAFGLDLATFAAHAPCALVIGLAQRSLPLGSGCSALVDQTFAPIVTAADGNGCARVDLSIPPLLALRGITVFAQAAVVDPARSLLFGLTLTDGLRIAIGD